MCGYKNKAEEHSRYADHNIATVTFSTDGDYTFTISGKDQAENEMDVYTQDRFVIDLTAPEVEIFDIEPNSANNGIVMPGIRYSDTNYDINGSSERMDEILNSSDNGYCDRDNIPLRNELTFKNGYYVEVTALFIDIIGSSNITSSALKSNIEWNVEVISKKDDPFIKSFEEMLGLNLEEKLGFNINDIEED